MKNQNENAAVSDVTARMREEASILSLLNGQSVGVASVVNKLREFADSIDAAVSKTETTTPGNNAAMREALLKAIILLKVCEWPDDTPMQDVAEVIDEIEKASSAPPRNCDTGSANEQEKRFDVWVRDRRGDLDCTGKCPAHNGVDFGVVSCVLQWAQMPYEAGEGGAE